MKSQERRAACFLTSSFLKRCGDPVISLLALFFRGEFAIDALEPFYGFILFVFAIKSEARLIKSFRTILAFGKPFDYVEQARARFRPMAIEQIDSRSPERVKLVRLYARRAFQVVESERRRERIIVTGTSDELIKHRAR